MLDYIPKKDSEMLAWSSNFSEKVSENATAWEIPAAEVTDLQGAFTAFAMLYMQTDSPARTSVIVAQKNDARKVLITKIRALVNFRLRNPVITDAQRIELGLRVHDTTPTPVPVPASRPELDIDVLDIRRLKLIFHDMGRQGKAKPYGVDGAVIVYAVLDAPPASPDALTRSVLATRTPHILEFSEEERGNTLYVAICWQNKKGQRGPWSEIESAIIP
jgi:hypothetical protein